ncbi:MAG: hypothetical protein ACUVXA_12690 [Candidatus Jordarchaeum sp.]
MIEVFMDCLSYEEYENFLLEVKLFEKIFLNTEFEKNPETH